MSEPQLTESQKTCLRLVSAGMSSKEIAIETGLSPRTVDQYVNLAAQALGVSSRREAARRLVSLEEKPLNNLQLKPARIDPLPFSGTTDEAIPASLLGRIRRLFRVVPPIGGERDELSAHAKIVQIVKAAMIAAIAFGSIVTIGAWLQNLFA